MLYLFLFFWLQFFSQNTANKFLLRFDCEWFTNESFFDSEVIQKHKIKAIHVWVSEKKDKEIFENERSFLHYVFDQSGKLSKSYKEIQLSKRTDTLIHEYIYNSDGNCMQKIEKQPPFHFVYSYLYENKFLSEEIKVDQNTGDTNYVHYFKHRFDGDKHVVEVYNENNRVFKFLTLQKNAANQLIMERKAFQRNSSFTEKKYLYEKNQLNEIHYRQYYNEMKEIKSDFEYENGKLEYISVKGNEQTNYRIGLLYTNKGLIKSIVKREPDRKTTSIYRFEYLFGD